RTRDSGGGLAETHRARPAQPIDHSIGKAGMPDMAGQNPPESDQNPSSPRIQFGRKPNDLGLAARTHLQANGGGLMKYPGSLASRAVELTQSSASGLMSVASTRRANPARCRTKRSTCEASHLLRQSFQSAGSVSAVHSAVRALTRLVTISQTRNAIARHAVPASAAISAGRQSRSTTARMAAATMARSSIVPPMPAYAG